MIYVLREQLSNRSTANLSLAGQHNSRLFAEALRGVVTSEIVMTHRPSTDVTNPQRMHNLPQLAYQTASNVAIALGLRLECHTNLKRMVEKNREMLNDPDRTVLIVWRHDQLEELTNELLAARNIDMLDEPFEWDHDDYFSCITIDDSDVLEVNEDIIDGVLNDDEVPRSVQRRSASNNDKNKKHVESDQDEEDDDDEDQEKSDHDEEDLDEDEEESDEDEEESEENEEESDEDEDQEESHQEPLPAKKSGEPSLRRKAEVVPQPAPAKKVQPAPAKKAEPAPAKKVQPAPAKKAEPAPAKKVQPAPAKTAPAKKAQNRTQKKEKRVRHEPQRPPPAKFHREPSEADAGNCVLM